MHDFEDMEPKPAGRTMRCAPQDCACKVRKAKSTVVGAGGAFDGQAGERQLGTPKGISRESTLRQSPLRSVISTSPPKKFGSGTRRDPSVP